MLPLRSDELVEEGSLLGRGARHSYTVEGGPFTLAGWLEPAASVGGDTFDYSVDREYLYASVTDAMGHSTEAALLATLPIGSLRNTRRSGASPAEKADAANAALMADAPPHQFVTGQILRVRLADGVVDIVGHPAPFLLRAGATAVLEMIPDLPLGLEVDPYRAQRLELEAGDRPASIAPRATKGFPTANIHPHRALPTLGQGAAWNLSGRTELVGRRLPRAIPRPALVRYSGENHMSRRRALLACAGKVCPAASFD